MILTDNETKVDLLNNEAIAKTIIELLREKPDYPVTIGVHVLAIRARQGRAPLVHGNQERSEACA